MPSFPELVVAKIYLMIKDDKETLAYLPDYIDVKKKLPPRKWLSSVVNTALDGWLDKVVRAAIQKRIVVPPIRTSQQPLAMTDEVRAVLLSAPHITSKSIPLSTVHQKKETARLYDSCCASQWQAKLQGNPRLILLRYCPGTLGRRSEPPVSEATAIDQ